MGISTPCWRARASVAAVVPTPSAIMRMCPRISASGRPRPSSTPTERLRLSDPVAVSTRSPNPARPESVSRRPPMAVANLVISARPPSTRAAMVFAPKPSPAHTPGRDSDHVLHGAAEFDAHNVVVGVEAQRRPGELCLHFLGVSESLEAITTAVGSPRATSNAKLGPESTATRAGKPSAARHFGDDLAHSRERIVFNPFCGAYEDRYAMHLVHRGAAAVGCKRRGRARKDTSRRYPPPPSFADLAGDLRLLRHAHAGR